MWFKRLTRSAAVTSYWPIAAILVFQLAVFPVPAGIFVRGLIIGLLTALISVGMALIYRANRVLNFAQPDLGFVPASLAVMLILFSGLNYFLGLIIGVIAAFAVGAIVELAIIRRFFRASRLILTVATIGVTQLLAVGALLIPRWWNKRAASQRLAPPFHWKFTIQPIVFSANDVMAVVIAPLAMLAVGLLLKRTLVGVAVRASADNADRAGLLGVPVQRIHTLVWSVAGALAFLAMFLRAGIVGLPVGSAFDISVLLRSLAALMIGRLTNLPVIVSSSLVLGVLEQAAIYKASSPLLLDPIIAAIIVLALLVQKRETTRAGKDATSSWQASEEVRPIASALTKVSEVIVVRVVAAALVIGFLLSLPTFLGPDKLLKASAVVVFSLVGVSIVVLTGWAGQVSLGQMAFVGLGAAIGAKLTLTWHVDLLLALPIAGGVGAIAAVVVGVPALRLRGLYLAVSTLGLALATSSYLLNRRFFTWIPKGRIPRPKLLGRFDTQSQGRFYILSLLVLVIVVGAVRGVRRSRTGRVIIALRENDASAQSYGINTVAAKLTAFALSGAVAGVAGCLFSHLTQSFEPVSFEPSQSILVFTTAVVGGLGSITGAVLGAVYLRGSQWFLANAWQQFFTSALGVLLVLMTLPGGIGGVVARIRDRWLRSVARRNGVSI